MKSRVRVILCCMSSSRQPKVQRPNPLVEEPTFQGSTSSARGEDQVSQRCGKQGAGNGSKSTSMLHWQPALCTISENEVAMSRKQDAKLAGPKNSKRNTCNTKVSSSRRNSNSRSNSPRVSRQSSEHGLDGIYQMAIPPMATSGIFF